MTAINNNDFDREAWEVMLKNAHTNAEFTAALLHFQI